jgi:hypothetical protein
MNLALPSFEMVGQGDSTSLLRGLVESAPSGIRAFARECERHFKKWSKCAPKVEPTYSTDQFLVKTNHLICYATSIFGRRRVVEIFKGKNTMTKAGILAANPNLISFRVMLHEDKGDRFSRIFDCYAENDEGAAAQAGNAYPKCDVKSITPFAGNETKSARELAIRYGHTDENSRTVLKTMLNPDAPAVEEEMMDLELWGCGDSAYLEWVTEYGDSIGTLFTTIEIAEQDLSVAPLFVIYSANESVVHDGAGFWSNSGGWTTFGGATRFSGEERHLNLPVSTGADAKWASEAEAKASYAELEEQAEFSPTQGAEGSQPATTDTLGARLHHAVVRAQDAYWKALAASFPEIQSGDFSPDAAEKFDAACMEAAQNWVDSNRLANNATGAQPTPGIHVKTVGASDFDGVHQYFDCSTAHLTRETMALIEGVRATSWPIAIAPYDTGVFISVPPKELEGDIPDDLRQVQRHARQLGCLVIRFDADADIHGELASYDWEILDQSIESQHVVDVPKDEIMTLTVQEGTATLPDGALIDLLAIQRLLMKVFQEHGNNAVAEASNALSKITRVVEDAHGNLIAATKG